MTDTPLADIREHFGTAVNFRQVPHETSKTVNKGHGRLEIRQCWLMTRADYLNALGERPYWHNLNAIAMIHSERQVGRHPRW